MPEVVGEKPPPSAKQKAAKGKGKGRGRGKAKKEKKEKAEPVDEDPIASIGRQLNMPDADLSREDSDQNDLVENPVSTGTLTLDLVLGGGWGPRAFVVLEGLDAVGKSSIFLASMAACLLRLMKVWFFDSESAANKPRLRRAGIKLDWSREVAAGKPQLFRWWKSVDTGDKFFDLTAKVMDTMPTVPESAPAQAVIFCDGLTALVPKIDDEQHDSGRSGTVGEMFSKGLQLVKSKMGRTHVPIIATNQVRSKVRKFGKGDGMYGTCGNAVRIYTDIRLKMKQGVSPYASKKAYVNDEMSVEIDGAVDRYTHTQVRIEKNKVFSPHRECNIRMWFERHGEPGPGIDPVYDCFEYLRLTGQGARTGGDGETLTIKMLGMPRPRRTTWLAFKRYCLSPELQQRDDHILKRCRQQLTDGSAFRLYFASEAGRTVKDVEEDEAE